jgi:hypothetical protein
MDSTRKCPNFVTCQNQGNTIEGRIRHYALNNCPQNQVNNLNNGAALVQDTSGNEASNTSQVNSILSTTKKLLSRSFNDIKNSISSNFEQSKKSLIKKKSQPSETKTHKCKNFDTCNGKGNVNGTTRHYITNNCPIEFENGIKKNIEDAKRVQVQPINESQDNLTTNAAENNDGPISSGYENNEALEKSDIVQAEASIMNQLELEHYDDDGIIDPSQDTPIENSKSSDGYFTRRFWSDKLNTISGPLLKFSNSLSEIAKYYYFLFKKLRINIKLFLFNQ